MSLENVENARSVYAAPYGGEEWLALVDEFVAADCELVDGTMSAAAVQLKGPAAMRAAAADMTETFEEIRYDVEDVLDLDDRLAVRLRGSARGRGSGMRVDGTLGHLLTFRAGKLVRLEIYGTWDEAVAAAGLG
jgi:ketosteroid isomerase-like protein